MDPPSASDPPVSASPPTSPPLVPFFRSAGRSGSTKEEGCASRKGGSQARLWWQEEVTVSEMLVFTFQVI